MVGLCLVPVCFAYGANSLSVSVTPPLFQLAIGPGETWSSSIKVVNSNSYDVTYYAKVVNFEPNGEDGSSSFVPLVNEFSDPAMQTYSLASWIDISHEPIVVRRGSSAQIPFTIRIPIGAEPGGHYGAILIGTEPGTITSTGSTMKVSSMVSSLLFVRIKGDAVENGRIREFTTTYNLYQKPQADFVLRFENTGNVHLEPQGNITIYNMWGKERGKVSMVAENGFGNVLPQSIRKFTFSWEGEQSLFDIGPYSAVVTLNYGEEGKRNVSASTYFWVVPVVPVAITLGVLLTGIIGIAWFIRRYIHRALILERARLGYTPDQKPHTPIEPVHSTIETYIEPIKEGVIDLRALSNVRASRPAQLSPTNNQSASSVYRAPSADSTSLTLGEFVSKYRLFFVFMLFCVVVSIGIWHYFQGVLVSERDFEIHDVKVQEE